MAVAAVNATQMMLGCRNVQDTNPTYPEISERAKR